LEGEKGDGKTARQCIDPMSDLVALTTRDRLSQPVSRRTLSTIRLHDEFERQRRLPPTLLAAIHEARLFSSERRRGGCRRSARRSGEWPLHQPSLPRGCLGGLNKCLTFSPTASVI
jgi:hypothetical protein